MLTPASKSSFNKAGVPTAGPMVATILVRIMWGSMIEEKGAEGSDRLCR